MDRTTTLGQGEPVQPSAPRPTAIGAAPMTLRARRPAYGVMQECLRLQAEAPGRSRAQRFWGVDPVAPAARSWFKGALGERRVAAELDRLGPVFTVLHAVPIGTGSTDIDHLVIGPTGVFSINTKNHSGQQVFVGGGSFMVGGGRTSHIGAAQSEGRKATRLLSTAAGGSFSVQPLLVVAAGPDHVRQEACSCRRAPAGPGARMDPRASSGVLGRSRPVPVDGCHGASHMARDRLRAGRHSAARAAVRSADPRRRGCARTTASGCARGRPRGGRASDRWSRRARGHRAALLARDERAADGAAIAGLTISVRMDRRSRTEIVDRGSRSSRRRGDHQRQHCRRPAAD